MQTSTNTAPGYSLRYAATWTVTPNAHGTDVAFLAGPEQVRGALDG